MVILHKGFLFHQDWQFPKIRATATKKVATKEKKHPNLIPVVGRLREDGQVEFNGR
jgi:hypothetical protein